MWKAEFYEAENIAYPSYKMWQPRFSYTKREF